MSKELPLNITAQDRILCWFSCGAPSLVAAKLTIERYGKLCCVEVINCDTRASEHADNYRFSQEAEKWLGQPIKFIRNDRYTTVDDVFDKTSYMSGIRGARCTMELKRTPRFNYATPDDIHVFGFCSDERRRIDEFSKRNPDMYLLHPLLEAGVTKQLAKQAVLSAGIALPRMYELGFDNNNCPGCVKASSPWYWDMVRQHFPDVFQRRCEQSRKIGVRLVEIKHHQRIFLDELPPGPFKPRSKKENLSCGPECGVKASLAIAK